MVFLMQDVFCIVQRKQSKPIYVLICIQNANLTIYVFCVFACHHILSVLVRKKSMIICIRFGFDKNQ